MNDRFASSAAATLIGGASLFKFNLTECLLSDIADYPAHSSDGLDALGGRRVGKVVPDPFVESKRKIEPRFKRAPSASGSSRTMAGRTS